VGAWSESWRIFRRCLRSEDLRKQVLELIEGKRKQEELRREGALRILAVLQEEGRLVDFLMEDLSGYDDAQVGSAARTIHKNCRKALLEVVELAPVLEGKEGQRVRIEEGMDPLAVKLEGNVGAKPPFTGILRHPGWRVVSLKLEERAVGRDPHVIGPAEVEVP